MKDLTLDYPLAGDTKAMTLDSLLHERLFRGQEALDRLGGVAVTICGAGALGSLLADSLARQGFKRLRVIDFDRVEARNVSTQIYGLSDVGSLKVQVLKAALFRQTGAEVDAVARRLEEANAAQLLRASGLVVDTFDNSASRGVVASEAERMGAPCLHLGMNGGYGEVRWDSGYTVPRDVAGPDVCDYPLARNLVQLTAAAGAEVLVRFVLTGEKRSYTVTLGDLKISAWEG